MPMFRTIAAIGIAASLLALSPLTRAQTTTGDTASANGDGMSGSSSMSTGATTGNTSAGTHGKTSSRKKVPPRHGPPEAASAPVTSHP